MKRLLTIFCIVSAILIPMGVRAQLYQPPFGGLVAFVVPCTCSFGYYITYAILHPINYPWVTRSLVFQPGVSIPHPHLEYMTTPTPTSWELGTFTPGGQCLVTAPNPADPCIPIPADGTIFMAGASYPGFVLP